MKEFIFEPLLHGDKVLYNGEIHLARPEAQSTKPKPTLKCKTQPANPDSQSVRPELRMVHRQIDERKF